jgi:hypothetical protein
VRCYLTRAPDWGRPPRLARNLCPVREAALVTARSRASDYVHRPLRQLPCFSACDAPSGRETQPSESEEAVPSPLSPRAEPVRGGQACLGEQAAGFLLLLSTALLGGECDGRRRRVQLAAGNRWLPRLKGPVGQWMPAGEGRAGEARLQHGLRWPPMTTKGDSSPSSCARYSHTGSNHRERTRTGGGGPRSPFGNLSLPACLSRLLRRSHGPLWRS